MKPPRPSLPPKAALKTVPKTAPKPVSKAAPRKIALKPHYAVCVIGGGPAGMMAAARAAQMIKENSSASGDRGSVILVEKNEGLGKKLLITGGGRCNVTNDLPDARAFLAKLKGKGKFLFSTFAQHGVADSLAFFHGRGMPTKVENEGRVFPVSNSARSVYDVLVKYMQEQGVEVATGIAAKGFHAHDGRIVGLNVMTSRGIETIAADAYILATGGMSHPETGSTGEGFDWLQKLGHTVAAADVALVPVKVAERWARDLAGVSHQHAKLTIITRHAAGKDASNKNAASSAHGETRGESRIGRMVFAHFGISGPLVLNFSREIREALEYAQPGDRVMLSLDVLPDIALDALDKKLQELFVAQGKKKLKNALRELIAPALCPALFAQSGASSNIGTGQTPGPKLDPEKEVNLISREERLQIGRLLKDMRMTPSGFLGNDKAIVASGGVKLEEVDFRTMQSRLVPNLYLTGDVLDIDRPSGGYSLQICWSTGFVAGTHAGKKTKA